LESFKSPISSLRKSIPVILPRSWGFVGVNIAVLLIYLCTTGCALIKLKKEINKSLESTVIVGRIYGKFSGKGPIIVAACSADRKKKIAHYTVLHDSGEYELMVDQGKYYIFAYWDKNSNLTYDAGEPAGQYGDPKIVRVPAVGVVFDIDIAIPEAGRNIEIPPGSKIATIKPQSLRSRQAGAITDLDDERFSQENGIKGFWQPFTFFKELGGNIYFLEKYDPEKTPILFIHGATGTPKGWKYFVDHIDRTRFQPWFFYYPTGVRINSMAHLLLWKLINLQTRYQFNKIYITAHSMGGLVARSFIINYGQQFPYVKLFISLATPWGGDRMAEYGVQQSPVVIPSWIDMQPEGDFIKSIYRTEMPKSVSFYMFCGYKGNRNPFRSNNDGTITLSSIMDNRSQSEAKMNYVFNEDHASILASRKVIAQYNAILDEFDEKQSTPLRRSGGYIRIHFSYNYKFHGVRPQNMFVLRPVGKKGAETVSYLSTYDNGKIQGPFPSGNYLANLLTPAGESIKKDIPVFVESNKIKDLDFVFRPDGEIRGCATTSRQPEDKSPGRPDIEYRSADEDIKIQSIQLKGNGIHRVLKPIKGEDIDFWDFFIPHADFWYKRYFGFYGLPAGNYTLFIRAEGYKPVEKKYSVVPGMPKDYRAIELLPN
jgi:pimeloyl-ACP methyl ester carboxylesterase